MNATSKYIVYRDRDGHERIEVFPVSTVHAEHLQNIGVDPDAVVSAGFVSDKRKCFSYSGSLGKNSRPTKDTKLLRSIPKE